MDQGKFLHIEQHFLLSFLPVLVLVVSLIYREKTENAAISKNLHIKKSGGIYFLNSAIADIVLLQISVCIF